MLTMAPVCSEQTASLENKTANPRHRKPVMRVWEEWDHRQARVGGLLNEPIGLCLKEGFGAGRGVT